jgi:hypothetical protein
MPRGLTNKEFDIMRSITYQHDHDHDDCEMQKLLEDGSIDYVKGKEVSKHSIDFKGSNRP